MENVLTKKSSFLPASVSLPSPSNFEAYARAVNQIPMLSEEEEHNIAKKWVEKKDIYSAQQLIFSHLRLVVKVVKDHSGYGTNNADLVQEGNIGLMKAVKRFNPLKNVRLNSYALLWIEAEIRHFILNNIRTVKIGSTSSLKKLFFNYRKSVNELHINGDYDTPQLNQKIAQKLNVNVEDVNVAEHYFKGNDLSWQYSDDDGNEYTLENELDNNYWEIPEYSQNPENTVAEKKNEDSRVEMLEYALSQLKDRERDIIVSRKLTEPAMGLSELSRKWNISMERVRQIETNAMKKIEEVIKNKVR